MFLKSHCSIWEGDFQSSLITKCKYGIAFFPLLFQCNHCWALFQTQHCFEMVALIHQCQVLMCLDSFSWFMPVPNAIFKHGFFSLSRQSCVQIAWKGGEAGCLPNQRAHCSRSPRSLPHHLLPSVWWMPSFALCQMRHPEIWIIPE